MLLFTTFFFNRCNNYCKSWKLTLSRHEYQLSQIMIMKFKLCLAKLSGMFLLITVLALQKQSRTQYHCFNDMYSIEIIHKLSIGCISNLNKNPDIIELFHHQFRFHQSSLYHDLMYLCLNKILSQAVYLDLRFS